MSDNKFVLDFSKDGNRLKISRDQLTEEDIKLMAKNIHDLSEQTQISLQDFAASLADSMNVIPKSISETMSEFLEMFSDSMSRMSEQMSNSVKETLSNALESLALSLNEIEISEMTVSEIMNSPEIIDKALPVLDVFEISEPQREAIVEYKKSGKIDYNLLSLVIGVICLMLSIISTVNQFLPDAQKQEIIENQKCQIEQNEKIIDIEQEQLEYEKLIYEEVYKLNNNLSEDNIQKLEQAMQIIADSLAEIAETND